MFINLLLKCRYLISNVYHTGTRGSHGDPGIIGLNGKVGYQGLPGVRGEIGKQL